MTETNGIDWQGIPLQEFSSTLVDRGDGTHDCKVYPHGDGTSQRLMSELSTMVFDAYVNLVPEEDDDRFEREGEVPVVREGRRAYEPLDDLTLRDLPAILDALVELEEESARREREERERHAAERRELENARARELENARARELENARARELENARARERRRLKKLGEWDL